MLIVGARIMGMRRASTTAYGRESIAAMNRRVKASRNHSNDVTNITDKSRNTLTKPNITASLVLNQGLSIKCLNAYSVKPI
jgi:hypothetical protein